MKKGAFRWFVHIRKEVYLVGLQLVKADRSSLTQVASGSPLQKDGRRSLSASRLGQARLELENELRHQCDGAEPPTE